MIKKWQKYHTQTDNNTDKLLEQLQEVQKNIDGLKEKKKKYDTQRFLCHSEARDLSNDLCNIFEGKNSVDILFNVDNKIYTKQRKVNYLRDFANYILALVDCCDEYTHIKNELWNAEILECSLKERLGIK